MILKKNNANNYDRLKQEFGKLNDEESKKDYDDLEKIHSEIEKYYRDKIKIQGFSIEIEKTRLEKKLGKYEGAGLNCYIGAFVGFAVAAFAAILALFIEGLKEYNWILSITVLLIGISFLIRDFGKDMGKGKPQYSVINISLKVLEKLKEEKEAERAELERKESWAKLEKIVKKNDIVEDVIIPKALGSGSELLEKVKKGGFFKSLFKKNRKQDEILWFEEPIMDNDEIDEIVEKMKK